ncbi:HD domain-containing protein [Nocardia sp. NPDC051570]|uniref:HD domain-containing protein n=1 Tax=Nocardia sp. NPDC051570 TaxID=3364324 RepID=UPI00379F7EA4
MTIQTTTLLELPDTMVARQCLELAMLEESPAIVNHCIRSFLFARLFAENIQAMPGSDYDPEILFLACVLHDLGLGVSADSYLRFEVDGANRAAKFLTELRVPADHVDAVWEAIALHTSAHIAEQRNTLCYLTRSGINLDFGPPAGFPFGPSSEFITDEQGAAIHEAYPRYSMVTALTNTVIEQVEVRPAKAPPFSPAAVMTSERQQSPDHLSWMERAGSAGRWGN